MSVECHSWRFGPPHVRRAYAELDRLMNKVARALYDLPGRPDRISGKDFVAWADDLVDQLASPAGASRYSALSVLNYVRGTELRDVEPWATFDVSWLILALADQARVVAGYEQGGELL